MSDNRHMISIDKVFDPTIRATLASSYGKGSKKKLVVATNFIEKRVWFEVRDHDDLKLVNTDLQVAIDAYNELP